MATLSCSCCSLPQPRWEPRRLFVIAQQPPIGVSASLQGLDFEARGGLMRPTSAERDAEVSRQRVWAAQTDTKMSGFQEQLLTTGDRAAKTAGVRPFAICLVIFCNAAPQTIAL